MAKKTDAAGHKQPLVIGLVVLIVVCVAVVLATLRGKGDKLSAPEQAMMKDSSPGGAAPDAPPADAPVPAAPVSAGSLPPGQ